MPDLLSISPRYALEPWQKQAIADWTRSEHPERGTRHGIFDIFTGSGKTILALAAMVDAAADVPDLKFAIVVPTAALLNQWADKIPDVIEGVLPGSVGRCGAGSDDSFATHRFLVYVINSAREHLASHVRGHRVMLVVDECHRAASEKNQVIFAAQTTFRLGLSATAQRTDIVDDAGTPLAVELQPHGLALGPVCHRLTFKDAVREGLLPPYEIHHHNITLSKREAVDYAALSRDCAEAESAMQSTGAHASYLAYVRKRVRGATAAQLKAAYALQNAYLRRKQWLYQVSERNRVAGRVLADAAKRARAEGRTIRAMLFNERVGEQDDPAGQEETVGGEARDEGATALFDLLRGDVEAGTLDLGGLGAEAVALEHSKLTSRLRDDALSGFRDGSVRVLVSVKALTEGIDVPDADVGLSVASTSSARQRIQTMGRLLRAPRDPQGKRLSTLDAGRRPPKELHLLYVGDTADQGIYVGKDWADETGEAQNRWWKWGFGSDEAAPDATPPRPPATEEEAWDEIKHLPMPQAWRGAALGEKWMYRQGTITRGREGPKARNPREAARILDAAARSVGRDLRGLFTLTPRLGVILKFTHDPARPEATYLACGRLIDRLTVEQVAGIDPEIVAGTGNEGNERAEPNEPNVEEDAIADELAETFGNAWFDVVKRAFLAAVDSDAATLHACRTVLGKLPRARKDGLRWVDLLEAADRAEVDPKLDTRKAFAPDLMDNGVRAYVRGQRGVLRRCREELSRRAMKGKPRLEPLASALSILLGETRMISRGGDEER